ncbi:hypothetical protein [Geminocystis herdmanii]|uniref:hypothetical protein n=1 Tax=Geminocystis herdmanii TaxID=669359 RepID=UPI0003474E58|nr:hypothetical protein [Geminocystis herdmanii]
MIPKKSLKDKLFGEILEEAGLILPGQIQVALMEQTIYTDLKLGEILVLHNWIQQQTADFFGEKIKIIIQETKKRKLGYYLSEAGLLGENQIKAIIEEQKKLGVKFGALAVLKGCIKQDTLTFFLDNFVPDNGKTTDFQYLDKTTINSKRETKKQQQQEIDRNIILSDTEIITSSKTTVHNYEELLQEGLDDIPWVN